MNISEKLTLSQNTRNPQQEAANYFSVGDRLKQEGHLDEAIVCYQKAISLDQALSWGYHNLGDIFSQQFKLDLAIECYQQCIQSHPKMPWSYHGLGDVFIKKNCPAEAEVNYHKAIALQPDLVWSYRGLGQALMMQTNWSQATQYFRQAIALDSNQPLHYQDLGNALLRQGDIKEAVSAFRQAIDLGLSSVETYCSLGQILSRQKQWDEAVFCFQKVIELEPKQALHYQELGTALFYQGALDEAAVIFCKAIELDPYLTASHYHLGEVFFQKGNLSEAISCYLRAIEVEPNFKPAFLKLRFMEIHQSQLSKVTQCYERAISRDPNNVLAYVNLAHIFTQQNDLDAAISHFQEGSYKQLLKVRPNCMNQSQRTAKMRQPDFIVIGSPKAGTSSLYSYLIEHPGILPSVEKEIHFFSTEYARMDKDKRIDWYLSHFPPILDNQKFLTGEASPSYLDCCAAAQRIFECFPKVKLIALLRDPVKRTISDYYHSVKHVGETRSLSEVVESEIKILSNLENPISVNNLPSSIRPIYLFRSLYVYCLSEWMTIFPKEQFLTLKSEEFYTNTSNTMEQVFSFLGLPDNPLPKYYRYNEGIYPSVDEQLYQTLSDFFRPHNRKLEKFLNRKFNWD